MKKQIIKSAIIVRSLTLLTMCFFALACKQSPKTEIQFVEKSVDRIIEKNQNTFGLDFKFTPMNLASHDEQEWGKAIATVTHAQGGCGTGFFISNDGLFLTNEHVIPMNACKNKKCPGITITRNFTSGGAIERFSNFEVIAQNKILDFTLVKVALSNNKKVPYLTLAEENDTADFKWASEDLKIIGHPMCGPLKVSEAKFEYFDDHSITLSTTATNGNSGSPLISTRLKKVVGLFNSAEWDASGTQISDGYLKYEGAATNIHLVQRAILQLTRSNPQQFNDPAGIKVDHTESLIPNFTSTAFGSDHEKEAVSELIQKIINSASPHTIFNASLRSFPMIEFSMGTKIKLPKEQLQPLIESLDANLKTNEPEAVKSQAYNKHFLNIYFNNSTNLECLKLTETQKYLSNQIKWATTFCLALKNQKGEDYIKLIYNDVFSEPEDFNWSTSQTYLRNMLTSLNFLVRAQNITPQQKDMSIKVLRIISKNLSTIGSAFKAEGLLLYLESKPELIAPGNSRQIK